MSTDSELLRQYVEGRSELAFTALVERHLNLVYSAALREVDGDTAMAEDISQAVFVELARKSASLMHHPALAGWLYTSVRHVSANQRRRQARRQRREQEAIRMNDVLETATPQGAWEEVRPVLDDAMHELSEGDRLAIVLRFFQDRPLREVGASLGITENAARMRVERALQKLHGALADRGITSGEATLAAALAYGVLTPAPSTLAAAIASGALAAQAVTASSSLGLLKLMSLTKANVAIVGALLVAGVATPVWQRRQIAKLETVNQQLQSQAERVPLLQREITRLHAVTVDKAELERLRASEAEARQQLAALRGKFGTNQRAAAEASQLRSELQRLSQANGTNQFVGPMAEMFKGALEQQLLAQMGRMKEKLKLSPEQTQAIERILRRQSELSSSVVQKVFAGKLDVKEEIAKARAEAINPQQEILALLTPEQRTAYDEFQQEENAKNARLAVTSELLQMQTTLDLTKEQQDRAFPLLYDVLLQQMKGQAGMAKPGSPTEVFQSLLDLKLKALEGVLSPAQLEGYRKQQQTQLKLLDGLLSQVPAPGNTE